MSQKELAERSGVSEAQVSRDERNVYHNITVERIQKVIDALDETIRPVVTDEPYEPMRKYGSSLSAQRPDVAGCL
jgi:transcriptional regulator with XRE-family HTH domain